MSVVCLLESVSVCQCLSVDVNECVCVSVKTMVSLSTVDYGCVSVCEMSVVDCVSVCEMTETDCVSVRVAECCVSVRVTVCERMTCDCEWSSQLPAMYFVSP